MTYLTFIPTLIISASFCLCVGLDIIKAAEPVVVASADTFPNLRQPQATVSNDGSIFVSFGAGEEIYVCKSVDQGLTFSAPTKIGQVPKLALGMRRGPRIVASDDRVVITAISHESGNVLGWHSSDGGESWSKTTEVNDVAKSAREGLHDLAVGSDGLVVCTWLDLRNGRTQIYSSTSKDSGKVWEKNNRVYASPSRTVCECCHPSVVIDANSHVYVMWRNLIDGDRDMYVAMSEDNGQSFGGAEKLGVGSWPLNACPMDGGDMAVSSSGDLLTVWRRDRAIYSAEPGLAPEKLLGRGEQPSIAATANGNFIAWVDVRGGDLKLLRPASTKPIVVATKASDPVLAAPVACDGPVVLVWESKSGSDLSIQSMVVNE